MDCVRRSREEERETALVALLQTVRRRGGMAAEAPLDLLHLERTLFGHQKSVRARMDETGNVRENESVRDSAREKSLKKEIGKESGKESGIESGKESEKESERVRECGRECEEGMEGKSEGILDWDSPTSEQVLSELLCNGSFGGVLLFRRLGTLEGGRCGLLPSEALLLLGIETGSEGMMREGKLLARASQGCAGAVLLVYFLASERYCGANNVWNALLKCPKALERLLEGLTKCVERCATVEVPQWICGSGTGEGELSQKATAKFALILMKEILLRFERGKESYSETPPLSTVSIADSEAHPQPEEECTLPDSLSLPASQGDAEVSQTLGSEPEISQTPTRVCEVPQIESQSTEESHCECGAVAAAQECVRRWAALAMHVTPALDVPSSSSPLPTADPPAAIDLLSSRLLALEHRLRQQEEDSARAAENAAGVSSAPLASSGAEGVALGDMGRGGRWAGIGHAASAGPAGYAVLQRDDGAFTMLNKAPGAGYLALSVGHEPKIFMDPAGCLGVGVATPRARLHVDGHIKCGSCYAVVSHESLTVVRGGFACRTLEPRAGPGYRVEQYDNGLFEVQFVPMPFSKRPSVIAVQHTPQEAPSLVPLGYVDATKFGFYDVRNVADVWIEFFVFGPKLQ